MVSGVRVNVLLDRPPAVHWLLVTFDLFPVDVVRCSQTADVVRAVSLISCSLRMSHVMYQSLKELNALQTKCLSDCLTTFQAWQSNKLCILHSSDTHSCHFSSAESNIISAFEERLFKSIWFITSSLQRCAERHRIVGEHSGRQWDVARRRQRWQPFFLLPVSWSRPTVFLGSPAKRPLQ